MISINEAIVYIMVFFLCIGGIDHLIGNRFGFGEKFVQGFKTMGPLTLAMVGIVSLAPVLAKVLIPVVVPLYTALGADPSMFATSLLALDMGGYALAMELAQSREAGLLAGIFLGTMMGPTIVFTIPVALGLIDKEDHGFFAKGILIGIMTIPLGVLVGGLVAGFPLGMIIRNLLPIILFAALIGLGLWFIPHKMIKGFHYFGKLIELIIIFGLITISIETLTGFVVIPGMTPFHEGVKIVGMIALMLAGAFPMVHFMTQTLQKPLLRLGKILRIGQVGMAGLIASLAHNLPMFAMMKEMNEREKIMNVAFAVSGAFLLGGHLGFVAGVERDLILAMMLGKLAAGISAVIIAAYATKS